MVANVSTIGGVAEGICEAWKLEPALQNVMPRTQDLATTQVFLEFTDAPQDIAIYAVIEDLGSSSLLRAGGRVFHDTWDLQMSLYHPFQDSPLRTMARRIRQIVSRDEWVGIYTDVGVIACMRMTGEQGPHKTSTRQFRWRCQITALVSQRR